MSKYVVVSRYYKYGQVECKIYEEDKLVELIKSELIKSRDTLINMYKQYPPGLEHYKQVEAVMNGQVNVKKMIQTMLKVGNHMVQYEIGWGWYSVVRMSDGKQWL